MQSDWPFKSPQSDSDAPIHHLGRRAVIGAIVAGATLRSNIAKAVPPAPPPPIFFRGSITLQNRFTLSANDLSVFGCDRYTGAVYVGRKNADRYYSIHLLQADPQQGINVYPLSFPTQSAVCPFDIHELVSLEIDPVGRFFILDGGSKDSKVSSRVLRWGGHWANAPGEYRLDQVMTPSSILTSVISDPYDIRQIYIADVGRGGGLIVYDVDTSRAWRVDRNQPGSGSNFFLSPDGNGIGPLAIYRNNIAWTTPGRGVFTVSTAALALPALANVVGRWIDHPSYEARATAIWGSSDVLFFIDGNSGQFYQAEYGENPKMLFASKDLIGAIGLCGSPHGLYVLVDSSGVRKIFEMQSATNNVST